MEEDDEDSDDEVEDGHLQFEGATCRALWPLAAGSWGGHCEDGQFQW